MTGGGDHGDETRLFWPGWRMCWRPGLIIFRLRIPSAGVGIARPVVALGIF